MSTQHQYAIIAVWFCLYNWPIFQRCQHHSLVPCFNPHRPLGWWIKKPSKASTPHFWQDSCLSSTDRSIWNLNLHSNSHNSSRPIIYRILPSSPTLHSTSSIILPSIGSETTSSSAFSIDPGPSNSSMVQGGYELIRLLSQGVELGNHQGFFTTRHCSTHLASGRCWGSWFQISGKVKKQVVGSSFGN